MPDGLEFRAGFKKDFLEISGLDLKPSALRTFLFSGVFKRSMRLVTNYSTFVQQVHRVFLITGRLGATGVCIILEEFLQSHETNE